MTGAWAVLQTPLAPANNERLNKHAENETPLGVVRFETDADARTITYESSLVGSSRS